MSKIDKIVSNWLHFVHNEKSFFKSSHHPEKDGNTFIYTYLLIFNKMVFFFLSKVSNI